MCSQLTLAPKPRKWPCHPRLCFPLYHHLIPGTAFSYKVPATGSIRKESVKVCTPESPPPTDDATLDLSTLQEHLTSCREAAEVLHVNKTIRQSIVFR